MGIKTNTRSCFGKIEERLLFFRSRPSHALASRKEGGLCLLGGIPHLLLLPSLVYFVLAEE